MPSSESVIDVVVFCIIITESKEQATDSWKSHQRSLKISVVFSVFSVKHLIFYCFNGVESVIFLDSSSPHKCLHCERVYKFW